MTTGYTLTLDKGTLASIKVKTIKYQSLLPTLSHKETLQDLKLHFKDTECQNNI